MIAIDIETYCETPISYGLAKYAETAELLLLAYAKDNGPVSIWDVTEDPVMPADLKVYLASDEELHAHNAAFEAAILTPLFNIDPERWRCSMAKCFAHGLPGGLEEAGLVLGLDQNLQKLKDGRNLIFKFCKPLSKGSKLRRATRETHPAEWQRFKEYCIQDVIAEREVWRKSPSWNYPNAELGFWQLDQKINCRGLAADLELAGAAIVIAEKEKKRLNEKTLELTEGEVKSATQRNAMLNYIAEAYDIKFDDLKGSTVETFLEKMIDTPTELRDLLTTRLQSNRISSAKYKRIFNWASDGRLKYTYQYCGASRTLRFSGRGPQGQNLKRPEKYIADQWDFVADVIKADAVDLLFEDTMDVLASMVRGCIVAPPGKKLLVSDLSGIEGCVLPWLAGDEPELKRLHDNFKGVGYDSYIWAYAKSFGVDPKTVDKEQRKIGKPISLSFGYGGAAMAFVSMAAIYGVDLEAMARGSSASVPQRIREEAEGMYGWAVKKQLTRGLDKPTFVVCDSLKRLWREDHPSVVIFWKKLEDNFIAAINEAGKDFVYKKLKFRRDGAWLRILLPSGTCLCYPSPRYDDKGISFMGRDQFTKQWKRIYTFGGKLAENVTSGTARSVLKHGLIQADKFGYDPVGHSHDEIITEVPDEPKYTVERLSELMTTGIEWADGLPLAAAGFETKRYRKE